MSHPLCVWGRRWRAGARDQSERGASARRTPCRGLAAAGSSGAAWRLQRRRASGRRSTAESSSHSVVVTLAVAARYAAWS
eukprot:363786-Chlamydomonas_euryale.AAC.6